MNRVPEEIYNSIVVDKNLQTWSDLWKSDIEKMVGFMVVQYFRVTEDIQDLKSELFTHLFERFHQFDRTKNISPWIITSTKHFCLNYIKSRHKTCSMCDYGSYFVENKNSSNSHDTDTGCSILLNSSKNASVKTMVKSFGTDSESPNLFQDNQRSKIYTQQCLNYVNQSIEKLPPKLKTAMELRMLGHTYQSIADNMNIPVGTVMSHIHHGKKEIRQSMVGLVPELQSVIDAE